MNKIEGRIIRLENHARAKQSKKSLAGVDFSSLTADDLSRFDDLDFSELTAHDYRRIVKEALAKLEDRRLKCRLDPLFDWDSGSLAVVLASFPPEILRTILTSLVMAVRRKKWTIDDTRQVLDYLPRPAVDAYLRFLDIFIAERTGEERE